MIEHLLDRLGYERVDVLGVSFGGMLAQQLAHQAPGRVRRLVLAATGAGSPGLGGVPGRPGALISLATPRRYRDAGYFVLEADRLYGGRASAIPDGYVSARMANPASSLGYLYQLWAMLGWIMLPWLWTFRQPTLVLAGDEDPVAPVVNARILARLIPSAGPGRAARGCAGGGAARCGWCRASQVSARPRFWIMRPVRRALHEALFEVEDGEPMGEGRPRFCLQLIDDPVGGTDEEVFGLAETARIGQRNGTVGELGQLAPLFAARWYPCAGALGFLRPGSRRWWRGGGSRPRPGRPCRVGLCGPADQMAPMLSTGLAGLKESSHGGNP